MRISDWSSDVCSSDLHIPRLPRSDDCTRWDTLRSVRLKLREIWREADLCLAGCDPARASACHGRRLPARQDVPRAGADGPALGSRDDIQGMGTLHSRSEEHTSELQYISRIWYAVF